MDSKLRIRSENELELQHKGLIEIKEILDRAGMTWFISGGTLLGAVRDKDFIKWDWDVGIALFTEEFTIKKDSIEESLLNSGFTLVKKDNSSDNMKIVVAKYGAKYELLAWYKEKDMRCRRMFKRPAKFYENPGAVVLRGHQYPSPTPVKEFLEFVYDDWWVPKQTLSKEEYFNAKNLKGTKCLRLIKKRLQDLKRVLLRHYKGRSPGE